MRGFDLIGQKFGKLIVKRLELQRSKHGQKRYLCQCDCGNQVIVLSNNLRKKHTKSCGCNVIEHIGNVNKTHGMSNTKTYRAWKEMHYRCKNPSATYFKYYGGRGIDVCSRWDKFENFLEDMGQNPGHLTLDRIDTNGNYQPGNCRWVTMAKQAQNKNVKGCFWCKRWKKWVARITRNKQRIHLGRFDNENDARLAFQKAKAELDQ